MEKHFKHILILGDSPTSCELMKSVFTELNIADQIMHCTNEQEALSFLANEGGEPPLPELILVDISLPLKGGFDFLQKYGELDDKYTNNCSTQIAIVCDYSDYQNFILQENCLYEDTLVHIEKNRMRQDIERVLYESFELMPV